ncbi:MAG: sulfur carrier protein ThiS [Immundisolibacter sp.]|uniref:sulfur carrier protein ThiS n=1 Tax=Immundisolibacter sp. TaxID=1934948 RepID=UPI003D09F5B9
MDIVLNGEPRAVRAELSLAALLDELGLAGKRLAVEVNRDIVPRGEHVTRVLRDGDRVEIIHAIGGG